MKKQIITFIVLAVCAIAGAVWIGYDTAGIYRHNYETDTREYEPAVQNRKSPDSTEPTAEHKVSTGLRQNMAVYPYIKQTADFMIKLIYKCPFCRSQSR